MRFRLAGLLIGCGLMLGTAASALACPYHDAQAAADQQKTAQVETSTGTSSQ